MNAYVIPAVGELLGYYRSDAAAANARGDAAAAEGIRKEIEGLFRQVPPPAILPATDELLEQRAKAHALAMAGAYRTRVPFAVVCRQGDYARRLDAIAARRGRE